MHAADPPRPSVTLFKRHLRQTLEGLLRTAVSEVTVKPLDIQKLNAQTVQLYYRLIRPMNN